jgi:hypothetical protein
MRQRGKAGILAAANNGIASTHSVSIEVGERAPLPENAPCAAQQTTCQHAQYRTTAKPAFGISKFSSADRKNTHCYHPFFSHLTTSHWWEPLDWNTGFHCTNQAINQGGGRSAQQVRLRTRVQQQSGGNAELTPVTSSCAGNLEKKRGQQAEARRHRGPPGNDLAFPMRKLMTQDAEDTGARFRYTGACAYTASKCVCAVTFSCTRLAPHCNHPAPVTAQPLSKLFHRLH